MCFLELAWIGYPILSWSLEWSLLLSSSANSERCTNRRARLCLQGMKFSEKMYPVFNFWVSLRLLFKILFLHIGVGCPYEGADVCTLGTRQRRLFRFHPSNRKPLFISEHFCFMLYGPSVLLSKSFELGIWELMVWVMLQDPQVVTGSHDSTIKFWDLRYGTLNV